MATGIRINYIRIQLFSFDINCTNISLLYANELVKITLIFEQSQLYFKQEELQKNLICLIFFSAIQLHFYSVLYPLLFYSYICYCLIYQNNS